MSMKNVWNKGEAEGEKHLTYDTVQTSNIAWPRAERVTRKGGQDDVTACQGKGEELNMTWSKCVYVIVFAAED